MAPSLQQVTSMVIHIIMKLSELTLRFQAHLPRHTVLEDKLKEAQNWAAQISNQVDFVQQDYDRKIKATETKIDQKTKPKLWEIILFASILITFVGGFIYFQLASNDDHEIFEKINELAQKMNALYLKSVELNNQLKIHQRVILQGHPRRSAHEQQQFHQNHPLMLHESNKQAVNSTLSRKEVGNSSKNLRQDTKSPALVKDNYSTFHFTFKNMTITSPLPIKVYTDDHDFYVKRSLIMHYAVFAKMIIGFTILLLRYYGCF